MSFPWPPLRLLLLAAIVGLVAVHWLTPADAALAAAAALYLLLFLFG